MARAYRCKTFACTSGDCESSRGPAWTVAQGPNQSRARTGSVCMSAYSLARAYGTICRQQAGTRRHTQARRQFVLPLSLSRSSVVGTCRCAAHPFTCRSTGDAELSRKDCMKLSSSSAVIPSFSARGKLSCHSQKAAREMPDQAGEWRVRTFCRIRSKGVLPKSAQRTISCPAHHHSARAGTQRSAHPSSVLAMPRKDASACRLV